MKLGRLFLTTIAFAGFTQPSMAAEDEAPRQVLFQNVHIFDGTSEVLSQRANVLVEGNLIETVSAGDIAVAPA